MNELTTENLHSIREKVTLFAQQTIGDENPINLCFCTCLPLSIFLKVHNIHCSLSGGEYMNRRHFWLTLSNYENIIIDPTLKQFNFLADSIYIGKLTEEYKPDRVSLNESFYYAFKLWVEPLLNRQRTYTKPRWHEERTNYFNLKFATVLNNEILKKQEEIDRIEESRYCRLYFIAILKFLKNKIKNDSDYIKNLRLTLPDGFDKLLKQTNSANC